MARAGPGRQFRGLCPRPRTGRADPLERADQQGHEIQIDDLAAGTPPGQAMHATGAVYGLQAATASAANPPRAVGNAFLIETSGPKIKVALNGIPINDYTSTRRQEGTPRSRSTGGPARSSFATCM